MMTASMYTGFLISFSDQRRLQNIRSRAGLEALASDVPRHIVLEASGDPRDLPLDMLGQVFSFKVLALREELGAQVAMLDPVEDSVRLLSWDSPPHVVLAHDAKVAPTVGSRVAKGFREFGPKPGDFELDCVITCCMGFMHDRRGWLFYLPPDIDMRPLQQEG